MKTYTSKSIQIIGVLVLVLVVLIGFAILKQAKDMGEISAQQSEAASPFTRNRTKATVGNIGSRGSQPTVGNVGGLSCMGSCDRQYSQCVFSRHFTEEECKERRGTCREVCSTK